MDRIEPATSASPSRQGIKWQPTDEEAGQGQRGRLQLRRTHSRGSMSIYSAHSAAASIDPSAAIPIQYRTLSIDVEDYQASAAQAKKKDAVATDLAHLEWHRITVEELVRRLSSSIKDGLSEEQVQRRVKQYGKNAPTPPQSHRVRQTLGYFFKGFGPILLAGSVLVFIAWRPLGSPPQTANLALAIVLLAVFFIQAGFNMWQDWSSSRVMASIKTMLPDECLALRDGVQRDLLAQDVVPGDVVVIKAGNKLPADVRFCQVSSDAKFDRSVLTGESVPVSASVDSTDNNYLETQCIGLQGTHCVSGTCLGVVVATGDRTVFGRIAKLTSEPKKGMTTLEKEVANFVWIICSIMLLMVVLVVALWAGWLRKEHPDWINVPNLIVSCVSVAVAFIPEGLPVALTASLTISANMMRKNKVLCKSLKTVETLGAVSVICSDKTGTLTQNKMMVTEAAVAGQIMTAEEAHDMLLASHDASELAGNALEQLRTVAGLCNAGEFDAATQHLGLKERRVRGDATDQAILRFAESLGSVAESRRFWHMCFDLAFNSKNKFMIRVFSNANRAGLANAIPTDTCAIFEPGDLLLTIKGAPDVLLPRCSRYVGKSGVSITLTPTMLDKIEKTKNDWSAQGRRVLLLAHKPISRSSLKNSLFRILACHDQRRVCCFTDSLAATSLAYEKPEADVLLRPPRRVGVDRLVDWKLIVQSYGVVGMMETTASFAMSYWYLERQGISFSRTWFAFGALPPNVDPQFYADQLKLASSIYFVTLVVMQWFNLLAVRTRTLSLFQHAPVGNKETQNLWLFPAVAFALVMAFFWLYVPSLQAVIDTTPVPVEYWFLPMTFGLAILLLDEARKFCVRRWPRGFLARVAW
ncbi:hypothetical protein MAPG_04725 [Magnaporthiopsis poae ATCC 64411]|uniref:Cation-transporting P-type ATPase N-terminal domain-containing protein n=1 Tax=Magnaporthiopsis poae (strain ATCC 64411 / 73-15) TaxID=644358 RepID=A0A0C4DXH2_MAGP6|nr:hypothetical protein MAPG_04725 [Magnaporthiopsis poae ATCC 64411]